MNRLLDPPAINETLARYECPKCGNNCQCGVPYVPKTVRVAEYDKANPGKSTRQAAADLGLSHMTVERSREAAVTDVTPETVIGRDGKSYPATKPKLPSYIPDAEPISPGETDVVALARKHLAAIIDLTRMMPGDQRIEFRRMVIQSVTNANAALDEGAIPF
jgi:hypothetical protein